MKIILPGDLEKVKNKFEKPRVFTCNYCECVFEATNKEYKLEDVFRNEILYSCECPTCHKKATLYD